MHFDLEGTSAPQVLSINVVDCGPGIAPLDQVLAGSYHSGTGLGLGIVGTRRLMDHFSVQSGADGTSVVVKKLLPRRAALVTPDAWRALVQTLAQERPRGLGEEVRQKEPGTAVRSTSCGGGGGARAGERGAAGHEPWRGGALRGTR